MVDENLVGVGLRYNSSLIDRCIIYSFFRIGSDVGLILTKVMFTIIFRNARDYRQGGTEHTEYSTRKSFKTTYNSQAFSNVKKL